MQRCATHLAKMEAFVGTLISVIVKVLALVVTDVKRKERSRMEAAQLLPVSC
jgi:hypothetical protein